MDDVMKYARIVELQNELEAHIKINRVYSNVLSSECLHCKEREITLAKLADKKMELNSKLAEYKRKNNRNAGRKKLVN